MIQKAMQMILENIEPHKCFSGRVKQGTELPFINHFQVDGPAERSKDSVRTVQTVRYQVDVYHKSVEHATDLSDNIETTLDGYKGVEQGVKIDSIIFRDRQQDYDNAAKAHRIINEFSIRIKP